MLLSKNKKGLFNNEVVERYIAGVVLKGYEVKAIREKQVNFEGAYIRVEEGRAYVVNLHIGRYSTQSQEFSDSQTRRTRELLLNKYELLQLSRELAEKGRTAIPTALVLRNNKIKLELAVVKGRKKHEKKGLLKKRQVEIDLQKQVKNARLV